MQIKLLLILLSFSLLSGSLEAKDYKWSKKLTFLGFLKKHHIPQKVFYDLDHDDKELIQEIRAGQSYSINWKKRKIVDVKIPISDELMLLIKRKGKTYSAKYVPIPYELIEKTISIRVKYGYKKDLYKATKTWYYGKELEEVYSKSLPLKKMRRGDRIIIFYTQKYRNKKAFTSPQIEACMIEINRRPYYGFRMNDNKYYDSLGKKYQRTYRTKYIRPVRNYKRISSGFTHRRYHPILRRYRAHLGIDYAARTGTAIISTAKGKVIHKGWKGGYGRTVMVQHANGIRTLYAHMRSYARGIRVGKYVSQGRVLGYVGTSGRSTGPHLHFGLYKHGKPVNPARYVSRKSAKRVKLRGKSYKILRKKVFHYRPQFRETKGRIIIKKESKRCLNCLKKLIKRKK